MLTCIVCDREFEPAANDPAFETVPYEGTLFYATGHYGSTAFDPMDGSSLEIIVCDKCLLDRRHRVMHVTSRPDLTIRVLWELKLAAEKVAAEPEPLQ